VTRWRLGLDATPKPPLQWHQKRVSWSSHCKAWVAGSVIGIAREERLPNFRTTDAAFGELPAAFNDLLMPINELGLFKGSSRERHQRLRDLTYGLLTTPHLGARIGSSRHRARRH
jgi:hypothetical protein